MSLRQLGGDIAPGMTREWRRAACDELGHVWTVWHVPAGTVRCRRCARWEADPLSEDDDERMDLTAEDVAFDEQLEVLIEVVGRWSITEQTRRRTA